jgi:hypothetical protein
MRPDRTPEDRKRALEHVGYAVWMAAENARWLAVTPEPTNYPTLADRNAHAESLAIHARSMSDFFRGKPDRRDICLADFGVDWTLEDAARTKLDVWQEQAHKRVAHITWARTQGAKPGWPEVDIARTLFDAVSSWHAALSAAGNIDTGEMRRLLAKAQAALSAIPDRGAAGGPMSTTSSTMATVMDVVDLHLGE